MQTSSFKSASPRVVVAIPDPFPRVAGSGLERLRQAGVEVTVGVLADEALRLNAPFITAHTQHRPLVTLKWAQSLDGFIDRSRKNNTEAPVLFSTPLRQREIHRERMHHDAILVGYRTALLDDPQLTNRLWYGSSPIRVVLDPQLSLPPKLRLFTDGLAPTWVIYLEGRVCLSPAKVCAIYLLAESASSHSSSFSAYMKRAFSRFSLRVEQLRCRPSLA